jgi:adenine-specific DNA-methyltransferase
MTICIITVGSDVVQGELVGDIWDDTLPNDLHNEGGVTLKKGKKPEKLIGRLIELTTVAGDLVLDFFAGTGTTCAAAHKMHRRWIGIDVMDQFDELTKRRMTNTLFGESSGISSQANWKGGGLFAHQKLESYEDALNNICVQRPEGGQLDLLYQFDDYMLHYMLDFETRDSPALLAQDAFERPFDYTLKIQRGHESPQDEKVDLVETFHYLIGMHVHRLERHAHQGRPYVVSRGEVRTDHGIERVVTIWRDVEGLDLEQEARWANAELLIGPVDRVYVNGPSHVEGAQPLEIVFRDRMEGIHH